MSAWRYIAQRATTGEFLDLDLAIVRDELSWSLSGAGALKGSLNPDVGQLRAADGRLVLEEWGTLLFAEADGEIRWGGILISSAFEDEAWQIEAAGFTTYPNGIAYDGTYSRLGIDPLDAVKEIWRQIQSHPDGALGVTVTGDKTGGKLGVNGVAAYQEAQIAGDWVPKSTVPNFELSASAKLAKPMTISETSLTLATISNFATFSIPFAISVGAEDMTVGARSGLVLSSLTRGVGATSPTVHYADTLVKHTGTPERTKEAVPAEPYLLAWWEAPDCGSEINSLAREASFDYTESHRWSGDSILHEVHVSYPRAGRRRTDLAFVQGDNVISVVTPTINGDRFANEIIGLGAGEGKAALHRVNAVRDGRLRRTAVYTDKAVNRTATLDTRIAAESIRRRGLAEVSSITVRSHPNAPIGSWSLGDDVLVEATIPWLGNVAIWSRITGWALISEDTASLSLARSDSFQYGV